MGREGEAYKGTYMMKNYKILLGYQLIKIHHDIFYISSLDINLASTIVPDPRYNTSNNVPVCMNMAFIAIFVWFYNLNFIMVVLGLYLLVFVASCDDVLNLLKNLFMQSNKSRKNFFWKKKKKKICIFLFYIYFL